MNAAGRNRGERQIAKWRSELEARFDLEERSLIPVCAQIFAAGSIYMLASYWFFASEFLLSASVAGLVCAIAMCCVETLGHTASHNALTKSKYCNELICSICFVFIIGLPKCFWKQKHVRSHHRHTNVASKDVDVDLMPFVILSETDAKQAASSLQWYYKRQKQMFPILLFFSSFHSLVDSWAYLLRSLARRPTISLVVDVAWVLIWFSVWVVLPAAIWSWAASLAFFVYRYGILSYLNFAIFAPAHFPAEAACYSPTRIPDDRAMHQASTTLNFRVGRLWQYITNGVEFQIEHHLFPGFSHRLYPKIAPELRRMMERDGYQYRCLDWSEGVAKSFGALDSPKVVV
jgi:linoleoyl-CoA desaturase